MDQVCRRRFDSFRQPDRIRNFAERLIEQLPSDLQRNFEAGFSPMDQQVKGVELNGAGFQSVMLEQVEREPAFIIHGDGFHRQSTSHVETFGRLARSARIDLLIRCPDETRLLLRLSLCRPTPGSRHGLIERPPRQS